MEVMDLLLPMALGLGALFVGAFVWSARSGQYDDLETPRHRLLLDDQPLSKKEDL